MFRSATAVLCTLLTAACYNPMMSVDNRTALEQQLTRRAVARAVEKLAVHKVVLTGEWTVEVLVPHPYDESWIRGLVSHRLLHLGATVRPKGTANTSVVTVAVGYAGADVDNFYVGLPLPGTGGQALAFYQSITQRGRARLALMFTDMNGKLIATTPEAEGGTHYTDMFILTLIGPIAFTDLEDIETSSRFRELGTDAFGDAKRIGDWIVPGDEPQKDGKSGKQDK